MFSNSPNFLSPAHAAQPVPPIGFPLINSYTLTADVGTFALTGNSANTLANHRLTGVVGTFALTGNSANTLANHRLTGVVGTFALTGNSANTLANHRLTGVVGAFALTGNSAQLREGHDLVATVGTFTLTGNAVSFSRSYRLTATVGTFGVTGNDATLTYTPNAIVTAPKQQQATAHTWGNSGLEGAWRGAGRVKFSHPSHRGRLLRRRLTLRSTSSHEPSRRTRRYREEEMLCLA